MLCPASPGGPAATQAEGNAAGPEGMLSGRIPKGAGVSRRYLCPHDQRHKSLKLRQTKYPPADGQMSKA